MSGADASSMAIKSNYILGLCSNGGGGAAPVRTDIASLCLALRILIDKSPFRFRIGVFLGDIHSRTPNLHDLVLD